MKENRFTRRNRETVVTSIQTMRTSPRDMLHPAWSPNSPFEESYFENEVWSTTVQTLTGMDKKSILLFHSTSADEAQRIERQFAVGTVVPNGNGPFPVSFRNLMDRGGLQAFSMFSVEDDNFGKLYEALRGAGVLGDSYQFTDSVFDFFDSEYMNWAEEEFGENYKALIQFEYCANHFCNSSLAYIAAQTFFHYFITEDMFSAGALMREFDMIEGGAEDVASSAKIARKNAGLGGSSASRAAREKRLLAFLNAVENLGDLFPRIGERAILNQAFQNAVAEDEKLWRQGRGRQVEYETEMRSRSDLKARYDKIFRSSRLSSSSD